MIVHKVASKFGEGLWDAKQWGYVVTNKLQWNFETTKKVWIIKVLDKKKREKKGKRQKKCGLSQI